MDRTSIKIYQLACLPPDWWFGWTLMYVSGGLPISAWWSLCWQPGQLQWSLEFPTCLWSKFLMSEAMSRAEIKNYKKKIDVTLLPLDWWIGWALKYISWLAPLPIDELDGYWSISVGLSAWRLKVWTASKYIWLHGHLHLFISFLTTSTFIMDIGILNLPMIENALQ